MPSWSSSGSAQPGTAAGASPVTTRCMCLWVPATSPSAARRRPMRIRWVRGVAGWPGDSPAPDAWPVPACFLHFAEIRLQQPRRSSQATARPYPGRGRVCTGTGSGRSARLCPPLPGAAGPCPLGCGSGGPLLTSCPGEEVRAPLTPERPLPHRPQACLCLWPPALEPRGRLLRGAPAERPLAMQRCEWAPAPAAGWGGAALAALGVGVGLVRG